MDKLSESQIHTIYTPFALKPCAETAQAILDEPRMPERFRKPAFNYTDMGQKCRAEEARSRAGQALRNFLNNRDFLTADETTQIEAALTLIEQIGKHPEYQDARDYQTGLNINASIAAYSKGKC